MENNNDLNSPLKNPTVKSTDTLFSPKNIIVVYTALSILLKMRSDLGLEAMLEYMGKYLSAIETHNPQMKCAVIKVLTLISVEKIYLDAIRNEKT